MAFFVKRSSTIYFFISFFIFCAVLLFPSSGYAYYTCGSGPCNGSYPCNSGMTCSGGRCGVYYDVCSGATCVDNGGWDQNLCNTGNQCTGAGTTRTASWSIGACSTNCGANTRTNTCICGSQNNCSVSCSSPSGSCGSTSQESCGCTTSNPIAPSNVTATQNGCASPAHSATISWTFSDTGVGCGTSWGENCSGNKTQNFTIQDASSVTVYGTVDKSLRTVSQTFPNWGTYSIKVCATNGSSSQCSGSVTVTLTRPACSITANPANGTCMNSVPVLSATYGTSCTDQASFTINGVETSGTLSTPSWAAHAAPANTYTGASGFAWSVTGSSSSNKCGSVTVSGSPNLNIDNTVPTPATETLTSFVDPSCPGKLGVTYAWSSITDLGCAGASSSPYYPEIATDNSFISLIPCDWTSQTSVSTNSTTFTGGTTIYARVRTSDNLNTSPYTSTKQLLIPTPTLYPTIQVNGSFIEENGVDGGGSKTCTPMTVDRTKISVNITGTSITSNCVLTPLTGDDVTGYTCSIAVNNQTDPCATLDQIIHITATYGQTGDYENGEWRASCSSSADNTINSSMPGSTNTRSLFFTYTGGGTGGSTTWFKLRDASFASKPSSRNNIISYDVQPFDSDDTTDKYLIVNNAGAILGNTLYMGPSFDKYSSTNTIYMSPYSLLQHQSAQTFIDYIKARKEYKSITSLDGITKDGIYIWNGDMTLSDVPTAFNTYNVVLITNGTITISPTIFNPSKSVALFANSIVFDSTTTQADGVFIANSINTGSSTNYLKIKGNLINLDSDGLINKRKPVSFKKPALFVVFDIKKYIDLFPYMTTSIYDWKQVQ